MYFCNIHILHCLQVEQKRDNVELIIRRCLPRIEEAFVVKLNEPEFLFDKPEKDGVWVEVDTIRLSFDFAVQLPTFIRNTKASAARLKNRPVQGDKFESDYAWRDQAVKAMRKIWPEIKLSPKKYTVERFDEEKLRGISAWVNTSNSVSVAMPVSFQNRAGNSECVFDRGTGRLLVMHCGGFFARKPVASAAVKEKG